MSAAKTKHNRPSELLLGPLPCEKINVTLGLELEDGEVVFTGAAQVHASRRHGDDYARCLPFVGAIVANPLYLGDDFNNPDKIEVVGRVPALGTAVLVAVKILPDDDGRYHVVSLYPISHAKVDSRRSKGHLKTCK